MYMMARIYPTDGQARGAADALVAAGYSKDDVAVLASQAPQETVTAAAVDAAGAEGAPVAETAPAAAPAAPSADDMANAVRVGRMLGSHADFYISQLTDGRSLVVATPPFIASRRAEMILDEHNPLAISHEPPAKPFVPISEQATPFSDWLRLPVLSDGGPLLSNLLGFKTKQEGLSHFSQWFAPLSPNFMFSNLIGMRLATNSDTPLSSLLNMSTKSNRLEGQSSSFGISLKAQRGTPLSSLLGLPLLTKRKRFLYK